MKKTEKTTQSKNVGPIISTLVVIIVLLAGAIYLFASHINRQALIMSNLPSSTTTLGSPAGADDIQTLKKDLNNAIK